MLGPLSLYSGSGFHTQITGWGEKLVPSQVPQSFWPHGKLGLGPPGAGSEDEHLEFPGTVPWEREADARLISNTYILTQHHPGAAILQTHS